MFEIKCPNCGATIQVTVAQFKGQEPIDCGSCSWQHTKDWSRFHPEVTIPAVDKTMDADTETIAPSDETTDSDPETEGVDE